MRSFTRIPNDITKQSWFKSPTTTYLYTWLSLNADGNGQITTSRADLSERTGLSERQIRTALEKLEATKYVTKLSTKLPTKFATTLTVSYLDNCKQQKTKSDQVNDQVNVQVNDQPRAYKNDYIISCLKEDNIITPHIPPRGYEDYDLSFVEEEFKEVFYGWLRYKAERKEKKYTPTGLKHLYTRLKALSNNDADTAKLIVEQSYAQNWSGIFQLKENNATTTTDRSNYQGAGEKPTNNQLVRDTEELIRAMQAERRNRLNAVR